MKSIDPGVESSPSMMQAIEDSWDREAYRYDVQYGHGLLSPPERDAWMLLLRRLLPPDQPREILDVGTGTGFLALMIAELGHSVTGVDLSDEMLVVARSKAAALGLDVRFQRAEGESIPFDAESFDVVISRHLLWTLLEPERAVREWVRVVRPNGGVIAIDALWRPLTLADQLVSRAGLLLRRFQERHLEPRQTYPEDVSALLSLMGLRTPAPAANVFARSGLRDIRTEELHWIDDIERAAMPLAERWTNRYRRYLVEGRR